jgi:hypothetical protein
MEEDLLKLRKAWEESEILRMRIIANYPVIWRISIPSGGLDGYYWTREEAEADRGDETNEVQSFDSTKMSTEELALLVDTCKAYDCFEPVKKRHKICQWRDCLLPICDECSKMGLNVCENHR